MSKTPKITQTSEEFESTTKRFYIPGCKITSYCPDCGRKWVRDLGNDYLSCPVFGGTEEVSFCCEGWSGEGCGAEWSEYIVLNLSVDWAEEG